ncbi:hypothetical protein [Streptomyces cylindrosporus]|uniref:Secreted protein n=1 Tax=Streptomyces cylindrosporus TaxID=2927583 RepID=A0ABS9YMZ3_9ACTN|nr:hypothetical protein [Streptomyces cylindrosporus]MCI3277216.1 hypothetical protein [Streptomyces cylindrosporus]
MIPSSVSRHPVFWATVPFLCAALAGSGLVSTPAAANVLLDEPTAVSGYTYVERHSTYDSSSSRSVSAPCPSGKVVLAGGVRMVGGRHGVLLRGSYPVHSSAGDRWTASAEEVGAGSTAKWQLRAYAVCADKPAGLTYKQADSAFDSFSPKIVAVACPASTRLIGLGARITGADHRVGLNSLTLTRGLRAGYARASEAMPTARRWDITTYAVCADPLQQTFHESAWKHAAATASSKTAVARCWPGSRAYATGLRFYGSGATLDRLAPTELRPTPIPPVRAEGVAGLSELAPGTPATWAVKAQVICVR